MAKNSIRDYSATNSSNTDIQSIDISEGCSPAGINNAIREVMADLKDVSTGAVALESPAFDSASLTGDLTFGDSDKAVFGAGADLEISHNGTENVIDSNAGTLVLRSAGAGTIELRDQGSQVLAQFNDNSDAKLYYNNNLKIATTATGVNVTGALTTTAGATIAGGDLLLDEGSPEIIFQTGASHYNWMIAAQENVSNALEISSGSQDGDYSNDTWTPRLVITNDGSVGIGTSAPASSTTHMALRRSSLDRTQLVMGHSDTGNRTLVNFFGNGSQAGSINVSPSATSYVTSSDYRLKENVVADWDATTRLKQLKPVRFNFIADADTTVDGFLAHEVEDIVPEAITGEKDAMMDEEYEVSAATGDIYTPATDDADEVIHSANVENPDTLEEGYQWRETTAAVMGTRSVPEYQGIDQSKLTPLLTKALIESVAKIEALEVRIAALETA